MENRFAEMRSNASPQHKERHKQKVELREKRQHSPPQQLINDTDNSDESSQTL